MTLLKGSDTNSREINVALLSLEADIKNKISGFDTSAIDKQLAEINSRIDKINAGGNNSSAVINDIRYEIEDINSKLNGNSAKIKNIEQKLTDIFSAENKVTDFNTTTDSGIYYWVTDAANRPSDYGVLLVNKYDGGNNTSSLWINQVAYGTNSKIYFRQNINSGSWTEWKAVAFDGEITAKKVANALTVNGKTYDGSEAVDAGVQTVANGGTGVTTQADINKAFIGNLDTGESDVTDGTEFVSSYASDSGFSSTDEGSLHTPYKRQFIKVWNYIKGKISSVLGLTKDNYGGTAAAILDYVRGTPIKVRWSGPGIDSAEWYPAFNADGSALEPINRTNIHAGKSDRTTGISYTGESDGCISAQQTSMSFNGSPDGDWASYIICNHGNGTTYYHQMLRLAFFRDSIQFQRRVNGELQGWKNVAIMENENTWSGRQNFTTAKASNKLVIPIGAPSQLEDGCIWIER